MLVYLIGLPGSGKTTLGKEIAKTLNLEFLDLDDYIIAKTKRTIADIFSNEGEEAFRKTEQACLNEVALLKNTVISTGGGTPCFFDNMDVINKTGKSIYLNVPLNIIVKRLQEAEEQRPMFADMDETAITQKLSDLLEKRNFFYRQANKEVIIKQPKQALDDILSVLK